MLISKIKKLTADYLSETISYRAHIHANPELSFEEFETSKFIQSQLTNWGIPFQIMGNTGVVVLLTGEKATSEKVIALRADIDALPIHEISDKPYKSSVSGVMHACGHDVHTASLLTCIKILNECKADFAGSIKFIFQPAEEKLPGGASILIKEGVLKNPVPHHILGQHVMPLIEVGKVGFRNGKYMASTDELYFTVKGKGGHGAMPHLNIDPVLIAAQIIISLQQVVSRVADPKTPSVLSIGKVIANGATNVIPNEVKMEGTFRTLDETWRAAAKIKIQEIAQGIAQSMGGSCDIEIINGYPFLVNEDNTTNITRLAAEEYLGKEQVVELDIWMAAEDFAYYSQEVPACFYRLGTRNESKGITASVHTPNFDIDESALNIGPGLMAYAAIKLLES
jgi:amidohydrolase